MQQQHSGGMSSNKREINLCDSENGDVELPNESDVVIRASKELVEKMNGFTMDERPSASATDAQTIAQTVNQIMSNGSDDSGRRRVEMTTTTTMNGLTVSQIVSPPALLDIIAGGSSSRDDDEDVDSIDGSPPPPLPPTTLNNVNYDVMLESVDLRARSSDDDESSDNNYGDLVIAEVAKAQGNNLWHGNVETSTDTLVPTNLGLTEEESQHFPGSSSNNGGTSACNGDLSNFLTKREENEEMRFQRIAESTDREIANGIDCSVYGERNAFNMGLLNNQSLYMDLPSAATRTTTVAAVDLVDDNKINMMDMSLIESVIQTQPQLKRHRRTPSNSKSEPSPHKFQNGK